MYFGLQLSLRDLPLDAGAHSHSFESALDRVGDLEITTSDLTYMGLLSPQWHAAACLFANQSRFAAVR
ncbi:hypothetical protein NU219Hw_g9159t1 [Hortaea werneckii]